jgi:hypothetical protein
MLGKLELTEKELIVETMSKERAERAAEWLASQVRGVVSARMRMDLGPAQAIRQERQARRNGMRPDRSSAQQVRRGRGEGASTNPELQAVAERARVLWQLRRVAQEGGSSPLRDR